MEKYDYKRAIIDDVKDWIVNDTDLIEEGYTKDGDEDIYNWIYDEVFDEDSVTGNGAYFYGTEEFCSECLSGNFNLLYSAMETFGGENEAKSIIQHYEHKTLARYFDCTIRCYLLEECIEKALEELENEVGRISEK